MDEVFGSILSSSKTVKPELTLTKSSNKVTIKLQDQVIFWGPTSRDLKLDVFIPEGYAEDLTIDSSSGSIDLSSKMSLKNVAISSSSGDINLRLPENAVFYIDAKTSSGEIQCDFPVTLKVNSRRILLREP